MTGFGQTGPYAARAGFGSIGEAMGGLRYIVGEPDGNPSRVGISLGDALAGTMGAVRWVGPQLGQHNDEILRGLLKLSDAEIAGAMT